MPGLLCTHSNDFLGDCVTECRPHLFDGVIQPLLEIDEDAGVPEEPGNLLAGDQLMRSGDEKLQELESLSTDTRVRPSASRLMLRDEEDNQ